ncbi:hypothetical protein BpHYR1_004446, partial [Brachionus plicatilis]
SAAIPKKFNSIYSLILKKKFGPTETCTVLNEFNFIDKNLDLIIYFKSSGYCGGLLNTNPNFDLSHSIPLVVRLVKEYKEGFESRYIEYPTPLCNCYLTISSLFPET